MHSLKHLAECEYVVGKDVGKVWYRGECGHYWPMKAGSSLPPICHNYSRLDMK